MRTEKIPRKFAWYLTVWVSAISNEISTNFNEFRQLGVVYNFWLLLVLVLVLLLVVVLLFIGYRMTSYFLSWIEKYYSGAWIDSHIESVVTIASPYLGSTKTIDSEVCSGGYCGCWWCGGVVVVVVVVVVVIVVAVDNNLL